MEPIKDTLDDVQNSIHYRMGMAVSIIRILLDYRNSSLEEWSVGYAQEFLASEEARQQLNTPSQQNEAA